MTGAVVVPIFGTGSYDDNQQAFRAWSQLGDKGSEFMASHIRKVFSTRLREPITEESWKYALNTLLSEGPGNDCSDFLHESLQTIVDMLIAKYDRSHDRPSDIMRSIETLRRSANQTLFFIPVANAANTYTIEFEHSGLCMAVPANSTSNGASILQQNCNGNAAQQFRVIEEGNSRIAIFTDSGKVLDSHAQIDDLIQWRDFGNDNQRWRFIN